MWKLPILFPVSHPAILEYLGSHENRVPHFLSGCRIRLAKCSGSGFIQCGIWYLPTFPCCLTRCQGGRVGSHAYCLPISRILYINLLCLSVTELGSVTDRRPGSARQKWVRHGQTTRLGPAKMGLFSVFLLLITFLKLPSFT
jgi:hypothetical protein